MNLISTYFDNPILAKAVLLSKIKIQLDQALPKYLALHYNFSIDSNHNPVIIVNNAVWLLQLKQHEDLIQTIIQPLFKGYKFLQWKVKPSL